MEATFEIGLVSVVMPTYNRASRVVRALELIRAQSYRPIEVIIVDDGSTDETVDLVWSWARLHERVGFDVRLLTQANNGAPSARNVGLVASRGEFIQYMDFDDILVEGKVSTHVSALASNGLDYVWSQMLLLPETRYLGTPANKLTKAVGELCFSDPGGMPDPAYVGLYRRKLCQAVGPWDEQLICRQDMDYRYRTEVLKPSRIHISGVFYIAVVHGDGRINDRYNSAVGVDALIQTLENADRYSKHTGIWMDLHHRHVMALRLALLCERDDLIRRAFAGLANSAAGRVKAAYAVLLSGLYSLVGARATKAMLDAYSRLRGVEGIELRTPFHHNR